MQNRRVSFHIEENTAGRENEKAHLERCSNAEGTTSQQGSPSHKMFSFSWPLIHARRANSLTLSFCTKIQRLSAVTISQSNVTSEEIKEKLLTQLMYIPFSLKCLSDTSLWQINYDSSFLPGCSTFIQGDVSSGLVLEALVTSALHSVFHYIENLIVQTSNKFQILVKKIPTTLTCFLLSLVFSRESTTWHFLTCFTG